MNYSVTFRRCALRCIAIGMAVLLPGAGWTQQFSGAIIADEAIYRPVVARQGMVSSAEAQASRAGLQVLKEGGNAVDAAVTIAAALAVTLPRAGNLGGGGFMLIHEAESGQTIALDFRETAPAASFRDLFLNADGDADPSKSRYSHLASGVPGTVRGLAHALEKFGTLTWAAALAPAIRMAAQGIEVYPDLHESLAVMKERGRFNAAAREVFLQPDGSVPGIGSILRQPDLAASLRLLAEKGPDAFYHGEIADMIVAEMNAGSGLISHADLQAYKVVEREPVSGEYRGHEVLSMPPPSSGGVHIVQLLNILEGYPIGKWGHNSARTIHHMAEAMKFAYADRSMHLADPEFYPVPVEGLTSRAYADELRGRIDADKATPSTVIHPAEPGSYESNETTHFSVVDGDGNAVSCTYTLNFSYGSGIMIPGTGILLNNQMDDFSAKPGVANAYGLIGGEANAVQPAKRMLSSMSPTIVLRNGEVYLVTGSPGGSQIITTTLQVIMNVIDHRMNPAEAVHALRFHHQWWPDQIRIEPGFNPDTSAILQAFGHTLAPGAKIGAAQTILRSDGALYGVADPRRPSALAVGW